MPPGITTFQQLIVWLAAQHHGGNYKDMATKVGLGSVVYHWKDGYVKRPELEAVARLCEFYALNLLDVIDLVRGKRRPPATGAGAVARPLPAASTTLSTRSVPLQARTPRRRVKGPKTRRNASYQKLDGLRRAA